MMTAAAFFLAVALQGQPEGGDSPRTRTIGDLPLRFERVTFVFAPTLSLDWDVDIDFSVGGNSYEVGELSEGKSIFGGGIGLDLGCLDLTAILDATRSLQGSGAQTAPSPAAADFEGKLVLGRLVGGLRVFGFEWGPPSGPPTVEVWLRPTLELTWAELVLQEATSTLGTSIFRENERGVAWGAGLSVAARFRIDSALLGLELGWLFAGGRLSGALEIDDRRELWVGLTLSLLPVSD
ncbi:MAG TPA: hypothetical protein VI643_07030 [Planctomycetota bacterium]|nr:hypothetical protein [Planctomycetota bacterium]